MPVSDKPAHYLPAVGRHTDVLEKDGEREKGRGTEPSGFKESSNKVSVRRPSIAEVPEMKKPKLEGSSSGETDADMAGLPANFGDVSPGRAISGTQEDSFEGSDVDIPALGQASSPSFATPAAEIPHFTSLVSPKEGPQLVDLTAQDAQLDAQETDELAKAVPDRGAGLMRHLNSNSELNPTNPLLFNATARAGMLEMPSSHMHATPTPYHNQAPAEMPPWLSEIHQGLQSLHAKADRQYIEIQTGLQTQGVRLSQVEAVTAEHTDQHRHTAAKLKTLEDKIAELQALKDFAPRSPKMTRGMSRSPPRSPRSPRHSTAAFETYDDEPDMNLVAGGWSDARRDDAVEEARNILKDAQLLDQVEEIWAPYSRTSFIKIRIIFERDASIAMKRKKQSSILEKLRSKKYVSGVPGSEGVKLWVTRSKSPEERRMTRAIVLCKEFYARLPHRDPTQPHPFPENTIDISWNGKVFIGRHQLLGSVHRDGEPTVHDMLLTDARGNHLEWYLFSKAFGLLTGRPEEDLTEVWDKHRPPERE